MRRTEQQKIDRMFNELALKIEGLQSTFLVVAGEGEFETRDRLFYEIRHRLVEGMEAVHLMQKWLLKYDPDYPAPAQTE